MDYQRKIYFKGQRVAISKRNGVLFLQGREFSQTIDRAMIVSVNEKRDILNSINMFAFAMFGVGIYLYFTQPGWIGWFLMASGAIGAMALPWNKTTVELVMVRGPKIVLEGGAADFGQLRDFILS